MKFIYEREFTRKYSKLSNKIQQKFEERLRMFNSDPTARILNIHKLSGKYEGLWSMNITGDYRAVFDKRDSQMIIFVIVGTHSELFG